MDGQKRKRNRGGRGQSEKYARDERNSKRRGVEGEAKCNFSVRRFFQRQGNHLCSSQRLLNSYHCRLYLLKNVYSISFTVTARYLPGRFCSNSSRTTADDGNWMTRGSDEGRRCEKLSEQVQHDMYRTAFLRF